MKRDKRIFGIVAAVIMLYFGRWTYMAYTEEPEIDAKGFVQSAMDAGYREEYGVYADYVGLSEEEVKKQQDYEFQEVINQQFTGDEGFSEEQIAAYTDIVRKAYKLAKYEVLEEKKDEDGNYIVTVKTEPAYVFTTVGENIAKAAQEKETQGQDIQEPEVLSSILIEGVQTSIDNNIYGEAVTFEVRVTKNDSGAYGLSKAELNHIEMSMFVSE